MQMRSLLLATIAAALVAGAASAQQRVDSAQATAAAPAQTIVSPQAALLPSAEARRLAQQRSQNVRLHHRPVPLDATAPQALARALGEAPPPPGGFEAETVHLKRCLRAGVRVAWVPIPAIYEGQPSAYRPLRDSGRIARALARR